jgi:hypothetical protein
MASQTVTEEYCMGITDGREIFKREGMELAQEHLENLNSTCRKFAASSPVGQYLRGERDFWKHQIKKAGA